MKRESWYRKDELEAWFLPKNKTQSIVKIFFFSANSYLCRETKSISTIHKCDTGVFEADTENFALLTHCLHTDAYL